MKHEHLFEKRRGGEERCNLASLKQRKAGSGYFFEVTSIYEIYPRFLYVFFQPA